MRKRNRNRTKRVSYPALLPLSIVFILLGGITGYAAMVAKDKKENSFQIGVVAADIEEVFTPPASTLSPGQKVEKEVKVTNNGTLTQFVRVMVLPKIMKEDRILPSQIGKEVIVDINTSDWIDGQDGYYYYLNALAPDSSTSNLFTEVELSTTAAAIAEYTGAQFTIDIKAEVTNCAGDKGANYGVYQDAWWQGNVPTNGPLAAVNSALQGKLDQ